MKFKGKPNVISLLFLKISVLKLRAFTLEKDGDILFKEHACKGYGYDYVLFVYDQKGKELTDKYKNDIKIILISKNEFTSSRRNKL